MAASFNPLTRRLNADQANPRHVDIRVHDPDRIRSAPDACDHHIRLAPKSLWHLCQTLTPDHRLKIPDHHGIGVWTSDGTDDVEGIFNIGHPIAHRFIERIFEGLAATFYWHDSGPQQLHPVDIGRLTRHVRRAHVNHTAHAVASRNGGCGHPMLTGAGFCNHAGLAHPAGQHGLSNRVIDLVRTGVIKIFAFE